MNNQHMIGEELENGDKIVGASRNGTIIGESGTVYVWKSKAYRVEPGTPTIEDGEWVPEGGSDD